MARKIRNKSNPKFARPHDAGAEIVVIYQALHERYGGLNIPAPSHPHAALSIYWQIHWDAAKHYVGEMKRLDKEVLKVEPRENETRYIESKIAYSYYIAGIGMVIHVVMAAEHFTDNVYWLNRKKFPNNFLELTIDEKLKLVGTNIFNLGMIKEHPFTHDFHEILRVRNEVSHPKETYNYAHIAATGDWEQVPMNWFLSCRAIKSFRAWSKLFEEMIDKFENYINTLPKVTRRLEGVQRGIETLHDVKKPPKNE